jgi:hypothetical protein
MEPRPPLGLGRAKFLLSRLSWHVAQPRLGWNLALPLVWVHSFPKNQRFIFGQRLADRALTVLELLRQRAALYKGAHAFL